MARGMAPTMDQQRALSGLVDQGTLTTQQAQAIRAVLFSPDPPRGATNPGSILIEIVGYVGGGLVFGGAVLLVELNLERMGRDNASWLQAAYAAILLVAGLAIGGGPRRTAALRDHSAPVRRRLVGVLFGIAAAPAALAGALAEHGQLRATLVAGLVGLVVAVAGYAVLPTVPGILAIAGSSVTATIGGLLLVAHPHRLASMYAFVGLGLLFSLASVARLIVPRHIGLAVGAVIAAVGAHLPSWFGTEHYWSYALTFGIGLICFAGYWLDRATVLLVFGVLGTSIAIPEAVTDWTDDTLSGPSILLLSGAVLLAASGLGLWLRWARRTATG